ncbi:hypothetical protein NAS2_1421 [Conexivisphaera calida]|uniref:Major facilitator superfamily (MFS) profile domain-containing protein n=1 Tax=Conexivisphaera calida TaxID=1874277 RepID=A0A4P2VPH0_9ARCH|nr:hypothetical protein NAS2_1421 [Conexivisphaera calida]
MLLGIGGFEDGFALLIAAAALPLMLRQLHISAVYTGLLISLPFMGSVAGALLFGRLGDVIGRRSSYLYVSTLFIAGAALGALSWSIYALLLSRFMVGLGIGGDIPTAGSLLAEIADPEIRGRYVSVQTLLWGLGGVAAPVLAVSMLGLGPSAWRIMLAFGGVPPALVLGLRGRVVESRHWSAHASVPRLSWRIRGVLGRLSFVSSSYFLTTLVLAVFANYTASALALALGLPAAESLLISALQWLAFLLGSSVVSARVDSVGRRPLMIVGAAGLAASLGSLALVSHGLYGLVPSLISSWVFGGILYSTNGVYSAELFPTSMRSTCNGICFASGRLGGFLGTLMLPLLALGSLFRGLPLALAPTFAILALAAALAAPRTERVPLDHLERGR